MRTTINDFQEALEEIDKLLEKYEPKHQSAWRNQFFLEHVQHAWAHAERALPKDFPENFNREDVVSLACRGLMGLVRMLEWEKENVRK